MPYRRGQGLSAKAGPYILDVVAAAEKTGGLASGAAIAIRLLETDHLDDQMAALEWLKKQDFVLRERIAVAGNSFGGIETVLGAERGSYFAAIDAAGGAISWQKSPELRALMIQAVRNSRVPIFFFQAENDYDLSPSRVLSDAMRSAGKTSRMKIYPPFGKTPAEGHNFAYRGCDIWAEDVFSFLQQPNPPVK